MAGPRWERFRRLCRYYRDCVRFDEHDRLRVRADHRGDSWAVVDLAAALALGADDAAPVELPLEGPLIGLAATARQREDWCCYLGHPVLTQRHRAGDWLVPLLVLPLRIELAGRVLRLHRDGPILPNRAALELCFADTAERQACLERVGLVPAELGVAAAAAPGPDLAELVRRLAEEGVLDPDADRSALIAVTRRGQYHRRLAEELHLLAEATPDEELEASALRLVFTDDRPMAPARPADNGPLVTEHPLDPAQRQALEAVLHGELTVVTGPPGTGKSVMVRHALVNLALRGGSALLASHNHRALDAVEPALNALGRREPLIVRTSHHGHSRSWRHGLEELLERADGDLADPQGAERRWRQEQETVAALEADLGTLDTLTARHRETARTWSRGIAALPPALRARLAEGDWDGPSTGELERLEGALQELARSGLRRLLPPGAARRRAALLAELAAWCDRLGLSGPDPASDDAAGQILARLRAAEDCRRAWTRCQELEQRHRRLAVDRERCLCDLAVAGRRAWRAGVEVLVERAVAGPDDEDDRQALANLRAGVATFGLARWATAYRERFPLLLANRPLWACTNLSAPATLPRRGGIFDLLVLDEAGQCDVPGIIPLLFRCRRVVAVGDPQQLGHITRLSPLQDERLLAAHGLTDLADQRFAYRGTDAWRLLRETPGAPPPILLAEHYRCHPQIASLFNRAFYRERLTVRTDPAALAAPAGLGCGVHWHAVRAPLLPVPHGACAPAEADHVAKLLRDLERAGYGGSIGVATPFRAQVDLITGRIRAACSEAFRQRTRLLVATAHGFQGDERDCLFFSLCGGEDLRPGAARFLAATPNLFNVAISRARAALHIIGDRGWASASGLPFIRELALGAAEEADPAGDVLPESEPERRLHAALAAAGITAHPQFAVAGRRLDLAVVDERHRLAIEVDGQAHHATAAGARGDDDCWRDLLLAERGWRILRFWAYEIRDHCADCVARVLRALGREPGNGDG